VTTAITPFPARCAADRGRGRELTAELRNILLEIRKEHPHVSVPTILTTLVADGRLSNGAVSPSTVRRFCAEHGLDRVALRHGERDKVRHRWQAERPGVPFDPAKALLDRALGATKKEEEP